MAFVAGLLLPYFIPAIKSKLLPIKRRQKQCELVARAIFQKAALHRTSKYTGFLLFVSELERQCTLLWDIGVDQKLPPPLQQQLIANFDVVFNHQNPAKSLLSAMQQCSPIFEQCLRRQTADINELPDVLEVEL